MQKNNCLLSALCCFLILALTFSGNVQAAEIQVLNILPTYNEANNILSLIFDGEEAVLDIKPFINKEGHAMILADEFAELLGLQLDLVDNNQLQLTQGEKIISFRAYENVYLKNNSLSALDTAPLKSNAGIFIPLREAAEEFGITVDYIADTKTVMLYSEPPEVNEIEPVLAFDFPQNLGLWGKITPGSDLAELWSGYNLLGGYFTRLNNSPANRTNNIILACSQINGNLLRPGEIFSFNEVVGQRTAEKGYLSASVFVGRKVVPGIGGGICQISSTLYNVALETGMEVVERYPHSLPVTYIASGRDATVLWGGADFKFKNNQDNQLKILTGVYGNYVVAVLVIVD